MKWTKEMIAASIDHTLLKATATKDQVKVLCSEAKQYKFKAVCINPYWVPTCASELADSDVLIATVVGFPLGANSFGRKGGRGAARRGGGCPRD